MRPHQKSAGKFAVAHPYSILAMGPRTGKTVVTNYLHELLGGKTLIVAPAYLVPNWEIEIRKWLGPKPQVSVFSKGKDLYKIWDTDLCVISYDLAMKAPYLFEWCDQLFIDEAHKLSSMEAKRTQFFHKEIFENSISRVHLLTGTPLKNRVKEFYSLIAICNYNPKIDEAIKAKNFSDFFEKNILKTKELKFLNRWPDELAFADYFSHRDEYTVEMNTKKGVRFVKVIKWEGLQKVKELKTYLRDIYLRIKTEDVMKMSVGFEDYMVSSNPDKALLREFDKYFSGDGNDRTGPTAKAVAALKKVPFTTQYVEDLLEKVPCVAIYSDHREPCKALAQKFGVKAITGDMTAKRRGEEARRFQRGETNILCATIKSLSEGVSLTRAGDMVLNDPPWVPGDVEQLIMRFQGVDQKKAVTVHRIFGSPQDAYIMERLAEKSETIRRAVEV